MFFVLIKRRSLIFSDNLAPWDDVVSPDLKPVLHSGRYELIMRLVTPITTFTTFGTHSTISRAQ